MRKIEPNTSPATAQKGPPFFNKESRQGFFHVGNPERSFFSNSSAYPGNVQTKAAGGSAPIIMEKAETDSAGNHTGNYIFNPGHDGLNPGFFNRVRQYVSKGVLDDAAIDTLRTDAIARNGTVMHAELLLMAAMRNPANVTTMQAYSSGSLIIPMNRIRQSDEDYLTNFGREPLSSDIVLLNLRVMAAKYGISGEKIEDAEQALDTQAAQEIRQYAGNQFSDQADKLTVSATSKPEVPLTEILLAMLNGASDSTPGDRIMAGIVYDIAKKAGHPMAAKILSGALKVDALVPSVYQRIAKGEAEYQYSTDNDILKADTLYIPTSIDTFDLADRALIIHELTHAADDFGATGTSQVDSLKLETHAYKEQGKYMMDQILAEPLNSRVGFTNSAASYTNKSPLYYWSMVAAAGEDTARYQAVLVAINTNAPMSKSAATVTADLGLPAATLEARVRTELLAYRNARGQQLYSSGNTTVDGPAGQYFHP